MYNMGSKFSLDLFKDWNTYGISRGIKIKDSYIYNSVISVKGRDFEPKLINEMFTIVECKWFDIVTNMSGRIFIDVI